MATSDLIESRSSIADASSFCVFAGPAKLIMPVVRLFFPKHADPAPVHHEVKDGEELFAAGREPLPEFVHRDTSITSLPS